MRMISLLVASALVVVGCGSETASGIAGSGGTGGTGNGGTGGSGDFKANVEHTFDPIPVESGAEAYWCQSWTLDNDETLYVNRVRQFNDGGWHHSNWSFVPEEMFGEDGTWKCGDRDWDQVQAALAGGVIFAQSTQSLEEVQSFPEGAVVVVPPRSKIVGTVHLFNVLASPIDSSMTMGLQTIEEEDVVTKLREVSFLMSDIAIPPQRRSAWTQSCDVGAALGESYNIYYVLGHYHQWGNTFKMSFVGGEGGERSIVDFTNNPGDTLGVTIDPPLNSQGATHIKYECGYNNTTDRTLVWGNNGQEEMCQFLAYIDGDKKIAAFEGGFEPEEKGETEDGVLMYELPCGDILALPGRN
jgi:hypothetical protein